MEKYTVIIPTRDRAETLGATLRTCLRQSYENFEIIVSDNCSADNTKEVVDCCNDARIRYINPGKRLSMSGNFEFALRHVKEGFLMFIGSDDGLMPDAVNYVDSIVKKYQVDAVSCAQATYVWPDFPDKSIAGRLSFGGVRNDVDVRNSSEWLEKTLNFQVIYCFDLPNLYCGFVHKDVIDKAYKKGRYFRSITPDAYSALATAVYVDKYAFSYKPFSIAGASIKSNGASEMHPAASNSEGVKFQHENDNDFYEGFIRCPSFEVLLAESFAQLKKTFPSICEPFEINYQAMLEGALQSSNEKTKEQVKEAVVSMSVNFGITAEPNTYHIKRKITYMLSLMPRIFSIMPRILFNLFSSKVVAVHNSADAGIKDIDDAALVAHVLYETRTKNLLIKNRDHVRERLRQLINL